MERRGRKQLQCLLTSVVLQDRKPKAEKNQPASPTVLDVGHTLGWWGRGHFSLAKPHVLGWGRTHQNPGAFHTVGLEQFKIPQQRPHGDAEGALAGFEAQHTRSGCRQLPAGSSALATQQWSGSRTVWGKKGQLGSLRSLVWLWKILDFQASSGYRVMECREYGMAL